MNRIPIKARPLLFGLTFLVLMLLYYVLFSTPFFDQLLYRYLEVNAWFSNFILRLLGQETQVSEVIIRSPKFTIAIRRGCDAVEPTWLLCSAIVAFRALPRQKVLGIMASIILLQVLNIARIVSLFLIGIRWPSFFNSAHLEIWPIAFILVAISIFARWIRWISGPISPHAAV